ncbi:ParB/RepB/Spo0J family partition protein [Corynebacterium sp. zg-331]|uniref:ParB/RepB/Spo0J family partition protein n=1 Tax=unclassified Corynebacterium TaxID=2624378 RepID=UPI0013FEA7F3|nr:ParB/RepB/Spo0J family partition protein [Corynebacterium sp. zg-331]MPV52973.1 ParB/RepB/Spo0J family partition protein [Corynebacterium sp. zg331]
MSSQETRKGGLGRGLGALIPQGPSKPRLSDSAADAIIGTGSTRRSGRTAPGTTGGEGADVSRETSTRPGIPPLIAQAGRRESTAVASSTGFGASYREIPIGEIMPNERQPRQVFEEEALEELVHSIKEFGLLQPIVVRRAADDSGYEIIMGERRWRAASKAGLGVIPAIVRETDDGDMLRDALLENIHRVQLNPLEEGAAYKQLLEEFGVTQEQLAQRLGRSRPTITNTIRLLSLPLSVQSKVAAGVLSAGHARALMGLKTGEEDQARMAERIVTEGLSVRATEEAVTLLNNGHAPAPKPKRTPLPQPEHFARTAERLGDRWDTKVTVTMGKRKGKMVVEFGDQEDFDRILALIEGRG